MKCIASVHGKTSDLGSPSPHVLKPWLQLHSLQTTFADSPGQAEPHEQETLTAVILMLGSDSDTRGTVASLA